MLELCWEDVGRLVPVKACHRKQMLYIPSQPGEVGLVEQRFDLQSISNNIISTCHFTLTSIEMC